MNLADFLLPPSASVNRQGPDDRIVLSSRVRLARNILGHSFPGWAKKKEQRIETMNAIRPEVESLTPFKGAFSESMDRLNPNDKTLLVERHLISREHAAKKDGSAVVLRQDESLCVMINEEDHLRMQSLRPGLQVKECWNEIDKIDSQLEKKLEYAYSPQFGYLTACPTNLGTAIRVSAMLHLPGLQLADLIGQTINSVTKLNLAVRGLYGEGTDALGHIYQVSNQMTLGEQEPEIVERLTKVVRQLIENEENAREKLLEEKPKIIFNQIGRAYGILANAHIIASKEAMNLLSFVRLGVELEIIPDVECSAIDELFIVTQPAHLQNCVSNKLTAEERDLLRADMLREKLKKIPHPDTK
ncbi:MAG: protein arginine kinase [Limisphaerales bacterium]|jgi:protein arginine kinase